MPFLQMPQHLNFLEGGSLRSAGVGLVAVEPVVVVLELVAVEPVVLELVAVVLELMVLELVVSVKGSAS